MQGDDYLIGCTHFGHEKIIFKADRPFSSLEEMDETMIENWNKMVRRQDTVWHLGDFCFGGRNYYMDRLNGNIMAVRGNHDPKSWGDLMRVIKRFGHKITLCHYPMESWNGSYHGTPHFHAHTHSPSFNSGPRRGNVCVEAIGYRPIPLEVALDLLKTPT